MNHINLPTTPEGREIVKRLIALKDPCLEFSDNDNNGRWFWAISFNHFLDDIEPKGWPYFQFRLTLPAPDSPSVQDAATGLHETLLEMGKCTCGFDAEGWRIKQEGEIIEHGDVHIGTNSQVSDNLIGKPVRFFSFITLRTNRHRADCPTLAVNDKQTCHPSFIAALPETQPAEKPPLDLSDLMNDLIRIPLKGYPEIVAAFERIQNHINQTK